MLDPHRLRIFRSVIANGSIQAAASQLGYTPSAVSQQVALLQRETGLTLFERSGRGIVPTSYGKALAVESDEVIASLSRLSGVVADLRDGVTGRLTMGYFASAGSSWVPRMARKLMDEFPQLRLDLILNEFPDGQQSIHPDIDVIVQSRYYERPLPTGYRQQHLADDPYVAVVHQEHPFAGRAAVSLAELRDEIWVDNDFANGMCRHVIMGACDAAGFTPRFQVQAQDHFTAIAFVAEGIGVTVLPGLAARKLPHTVRAIPVVDPEPVRQISVLIKESIVHRPIGQRAVELLLQCVATPEAAL
ncbi:DNA-binding transcriptional LysR family regulator [Psychromicrobium silvestre]|uniref:DNA-binding transcriptional LysR family regulator n=1 Tax=Psychromicrobium silvestre TaxID=1645614 RepID=A0A7Y9S956_9MICC|nr:LysR family transcriptional regulator [Psychromicrobium silvestre]NYE96666.1 DNA-binding transcriptional LysR family regulator [Psychromicrobium silvestre]